MIYGNGLTLTGTKNVYITTFVLGTHKPTDVMLCTLPDCVYLHINDDLFNVTVRMIDYSDLQVNDDFFISAINSPDVPSQSGQQVFGSLQRKASATLVQNSWCYYPPKSTDNSTSLGGFGKLWHNGDKLMYKSNSYFFGAGEYRIIITW